MFKGYSSKSKAKRGLESFTAKLEGTVSEEMFLGFLVQGEDDKWGFSEEGVTAAYRGAAEADSDTTVVDKSNVDTFATAGIGTELQPVDGHNSLVGDGALITTASPAPGATEGDGVQSEDDEVHSPAPAPNMFSGLAATLGAVATTQAPVSATRAISRNNYTIEKNRPEQNGIKRPSEGGLCRAVWDFLDDTREKTGAVPVAKMVREKAETMDWNMNNALIEFYQWRKFNGIIGRAK